VSDRLPARAVALAVLLTAIWGGSYTMVKLGFRDLPVFGSLFLRVVVAGAVLLLYSLAARIPVAYRGRARGFLAGNALAFIWGQALFYLGASHTTAGRAAVLFNTQPFFTLLLLPLVVPSERFTARRLLGTALAFAGVVLVFADRVGGAASLRGDVLCLLGSLGWSGGTILSKAMPREVHPVAAILWGVTAAIPVTGVLTLALEPAAPWRLTPVALASVLYLAVASAAFSFVVFTWLIRRHSAIRVNAFVFLSPVFGVLIGWAVLGEPLSALQAAGAVGVAAGIYVVNSGA
jgi:drug/metabolite transporter (DMT)-like permease